jgi:hypothetical protein
VPPKAIRAGSGIECGWKCGKTCAAHLFCHPEAAGISFLYALEAVRSMMGHWWMILKSLVKCSLDSYIMPGTLSGTEILLLYMSQWKRDITLVTFATVYLISSPADIQKTENNLCRSHNETAEAS